MEGPKRDCLVTLEVTLCLIVTGILSAKTSVESAESEENSVFV